MHRAKMFLPVCSHLDSYKRLHLLRYSIHILSLLPLSRPLLPLLPPLIPLVLAHHQCQYFVVRCIVAYYLSLPLPPILYCIILPRGNCSEFQPFVTRGEGGNNKCGYLDASTRFHVQIRETRRLPIKMSLRDLHYVVARHRAEILLSGKLTGEDVSRLVLAREKGPLRDSLTEFPSSSFEEEENRSCI